MTREAKVVFTAEDRTAAATASAKRGLASVAEVGSAVQATLASIGVAGTFAGVAAMAKQAIDAADALNDLRDATGASIENLSALVDVERRFGHESGVAGTSVVKLNQVLAQTFKPGSDAERVLKAIGLNAKTLRDMDPADALLETAKALSRYADDGGKARAVQELFGKSLREMSPYLKDLAEQGALNATVTTRQAEEAEKFNRQLILLQTNVSDLAREITLTAVPALNQFLQGYREIRDMGAMDLVLKDSLKAMVPGTSPRLTGDNGADINRILAERMELQAQLKMAETDGRARHVRTIKEEIFELNRYLELLRSKQTREVLGGAGDVSDAMSRRARPAATPTVRLVDTSGADKARAAALRDAERISEERQKLRNKEYEEIEKFFQAQTELSEKAAAAQKELAAKNSDEYLRSIDAQVVTTLEAVRAAEWEVEILGKSKVEVAQLTLAKLEHSRVEQLMSATTLKDVEAIEAQIAAQRRLVEVYGRGQVKEANAKAAEDAKREWDQVAQSMTDSLMRGGKNAAEYLKDLFRTLVLRPLLAPVGQAVSNTMSGVLGGSSASGGVSGMGGLLNNNSGLIGAGLQYATGASVGASTASLGAANAVGALGGDALGALITANGGWAGVSTAAAVAPTTTALSTGATLAGGATAGGFGSMAAAAIPYIGWAIAIGSVMYSMFGNSGGAPKIEGAAGKLGMLDELGERGSSGAKARQGANTTRSGVQGQYDALARAYGIKRDLNFGVGFSMDPEGDAPSFAEVAASRGGKVAYSSGSANLARGEEAMAINLADFSAKTILKALQDSNLKGGIGEWLKDLGDIDKLSRGATTKAMERVQKAGAEKQTLEERYYLLTSTTMQQVARARKQELAAVDESNRALLKRIHTLEDARVAEEKAREATEKAKESARQASEFLKDLGTNLGQYIDQLKGGPGGMLPPEQQLTNAKAQFERQLKLARGGDRDALGSITTYADQLIEAQTQWTASGPQTQQIIQYVMQQLGMLPKAVDKKALAKVPAYADGGDHAGGYAWVGERGPELAYFSQAARIYPAEQSRAMAGRAGGDVALLGKMDTLSRQVEGLTRVVAEGARQQIALQERIDRNTAGDAAAALLARVTRK